VDCSNAGASILHVHVRDPKTGKLSKKMSDSNYIIERLRKAVPKMVLQSRRRVTGRTGHTRDCRNLSVSGGSARAFGWLGFALTLGTFCEPPLVDG